MERLITTLGETELLAQQLAKQLPDQLFIALNGTLGAGKTTFSQFLIKALGYQGKVKSPTFTLVEEYNLSQCRIFHFDLYRIHDPEELELIGIRDYFQEKAIILMEWAERANGLLPAADVNCTIQLQGDKRLFKFESSSPNGTTLIKNLS